MDKIKNLLEKGVEERVYPGAVLHVVQTGQTLFFQEAGHLSSTSESAPIRKDTIFDLASLTKPLATTLALMKLVDEKTISLDQPLSEFIASSPLGDKEDLTPRLLLNHSGGFAAWEPFYLRLTNYSPAERKQILRGWLVDAPLAYQPGEKCLYSDLGFMILEWLIEELTGMSLHLFLEHNFYRPLSLKRTFLGMELPETHFGKEEFAATELCAWRSELIQGEVQDENAYALGGYSGHAGLFGDAQGVSILVNLPADHYRGKRNDYFKPETVKEFFTKQDIVDGCTWALGWDTPSPENSSSGTYFSPNSVGHLGFTGTSIWMDLERDVRI
ncbi:MAG: serine hydrolase, partial [Desulfatiglandales bacterium]|nr:serine hydrolase [Desulfatiglandales bacterium]